MDELIGRDQRHPTKYWHALDDGRIQCDVCPRDCQLYEGQRGACFVRRRVEHRVILTTYGRSSGFCVDPIEKKALHHFLPGSSVFSLGTAGCNLACQFCQNWDAVKARDLDRLTDQASPQAIARAARSHGAKSVAFTYNDPVVFLEYALDTADACHDMGLKTIAVTAGYLHDAPRREFFTKMDAAKIDLKGIFEGFYLGLCGGHLQPVLDTLAYVHHETDCWLEITNLLIPGRNDSDAEVGALSKWVATELGRDVPVHFSTFHPNWNLTGVPSTPPATLTRARRIALDAGLYYVYTGGAHEVEGASTYCPVCQYTVIERDGYDVRHYELTPRGSCPKCGTSIAGHFCKPRKLFGRRQIPVYMRLEA
jgi:pyruvate formate lyase activating enzyme